MRLLFITQKVHGQDAFVRLWVGEFVRLGYAVTVLCLEAPPDIPPFPLVSMGKEKGISRMMQVIHFWKYIMRLKYDRVLIHMSPVWYALGFWWWLLRRIPCYLWYTHYEWQVGVWLFGIFGKRFFCATPQSLPQFEGSPKKVVTGHGVDLNYWTKQQNRCSAPHRLLMVNRLSRSKRVEIVLRAMKLLPEVYTIDIYGIEAETDYVSELKELAEGLRLQSRVTFHGTVPMGRLKKIYPQHRLILNMASETIDKTMIEAMTVGCYPVTTKRNAEAIGVPDAPTEDSPGAVASFIQSFQGTDPDLLYHIVAERHSLKGVIGKMDAYIASGV
jgi:glycosyltransferase involved in cell wall biosynthesis